MNQTQLENLSNVVDYVLGNEFEHFCECLDYDVTGDVDFNDFLNDALNDDNVCHIYKDAVLSNQYLKTVVVV